VQRFPLCARQELKVLLPSKARKQNSEMKLILAGLPCLRKTGCYRKGGKILETLKTKNMIQKFKKKPVVIEAIQYTGHNGHEIKQFSNDLIIESPVLEPSEDNPTGAYLQIKTLEGIMIGKVNDWIIKGINCEFYPCKPDIFEKTYEAAE